MDIISDHGEDLKFFDALDEVASESSSSSDCLENSDFTNGLDCSFRYDLWTRSPQSRQERRSKFLDWMNFSLEMKAEDNRSATSFDGEIDRVRESGGAVPRTPDLSSMPNGVSRSCEELESKAGFVCRIGNSDDNRDCNVDNPRKENPVHAVGSSPSPQRRNFKRKIKKIKNGWLNRLGFLPCVEDGQVATSYGRPGGTNLINGSRARRVSVHRRGKQMKELSALYMCQEIQAHEGSILAMKFSPCGQYLASAGQDGIVRLWKVVEEERSDKFDIPEMDPSCLYFTVNHLSKLEPVFLEKGEMGKLRKTPDSACVVFPSKVFRILDKPSHEFHGHDGDVLDLCWSKNNHLLSASIDNTVRLWQVGCDHCLQVFRHNNYVTCVQFNPVDENYLISGSIDGKVRIWAVSSGQVVDWTEIKEIVTSVCYFPNGQGGVVGSLTGNCRFYSVSDNQLQLDAQICLRGKRKSPGKRITSLQFLPEDASKVMATCADSQIRILQGNKVIHKCKGFRNAGCQMAASLTLDGKSIISAPEDSTVCVWNNARLGDSIKSYERFSTNASVAIPWCGWNVSKGSDSFKPTQPAPSSPTWLSLNREFFESSSPKGAATWPEEKLLESSPLPFPSMMHGSQYEFLKASCRRASASHSWGMVIVTAGWDGRIRSFHNYGLPVSA